MKNPTTKEMKNPTCPANTGTIVNISNSVKCETLLNDQTQYYVSTKGIHISKTTSSQDCMLNNLLLTVQRVAQIF